MKKRYRIFTSGVFFWVVEITDNNEHLGFWALRSTWLVWTNWVYSVGNLKPVKPYNPNTI